MAKVETAETSPVKKRSFCWNILLEHLFVGAMVLFVSQLILADMPNLPQVVTRLLPLLVAVPFGLHFELKGRPHLAGQILGSLTFGCLGVGVIVGMVLLAEAPVIGVGSVQARVNAGLALGLGHFAGSMSGRWWQNHVERKQRLKRRSTTATASLVALLRDPQRLKANVETYRTLIEAGAPVAAAATAVWASFGR